MFKKKFFKSLSAKQATRTFRAGSYRYVLLLAVLTGFSTTLKAQNPSLELGSGSATTVSTTGEQTKTVTLLQNKNNPNDDVFTTMAAPLNVTYTLTNQQYPSIQGSPSTPGVTIGGYTTAYAEQPVADYDYRPINIGAATHSTYFSSTGSNVGTGVSLTNNYGVFFMLWSDALLDNGNNNVVSVGAQNIYFADLVITFSRPVNNPIINLGGIGGHCMVTGKSWELGMAARLTLQSAYTLSRLSGSTYFAVNGNVISNSAKSNGKKYGNMVEGADDYDGLANLPNTEYAASGSVMVNGTGITSLTFRLALDGDGGVVLDGSSSSSDIRWSPTGMISADGVGIGVSFADSLTISGNVYDDANGLTDGKISGPGTNAGGTLYAVLYDNTAGVVAGVVPVAASGAYTFAGVMSSDDYTVYVTTTSATKGQTAIPTVTLPGNWVAIGEVNCGNTAGCSGSDGTPDGKLNIGVLTDDNTQANFGVDQRPTSNNINQTIPNPGANNKIPAGTITTNVTGTDPEQGALTGGTIVINTLPTNSTMSYNGTAVTPGTVIVNFDPTKVSFDNIAGGSTNTAFKYSIEDAAGVPSASPANFNVSWPTPLPLKLMSVTGNRNNGNDILSWTTAQEKNTSYFEVQYSTDGQNFAAIGKVNAASNSTTTLQYNYQNDDVCCDAFYRLRMVDQDGSFSYSTVLKLSSGTAASGNITISDVYPVPFTNAINVTIISDKDQQAILVLHNMKGSEIARYSMPLQQGSNTYHLGNLEMLAPGGYLLQVHTNSGVVTRQIMKK